MIFDCIVTKTSIDKGWSGDRKYRIEDNTGNVYLMRISPAELFEKRQSQFRHMEAVASLGIPMCRPLEFGICPEGIYAIHSWIDGQDAEAVMSSFPEETQYAYGLEAGRILKRIHSIPAPQDAEPWGTRFNKKIDRKINMYRDCTLKYENGDAFLNYISQNRNLLSDRPQTYQHGDYHIGNMMIDSAGKLVVIDFDRDDNGDPWEEFNRIVWSAHDTPKFASGMVDGYFEGSIPAEFWSLLALYICSNTLSSLPWAIPYGDKEIQTMRNQAAEVLRWYDGMQQTIPTWYQ